MTPEEYHARTDRLVAQALAAPGAIQPCCKKGCSHCCYEPAYTDRRTIDHIIAGMTPEQIEEVKAKLPAWLEQTEKMRNEQERPSSLDYLALRAPCPLLKNGMCSVYERRPLDCRIWLAMGNPDDCAGFGERRRKQKIADWPGNAMQIFARPWAIDTMEKEGEIVMDHIGVLLAERLLGMNIPSAGRKHLKVEV